MLGIIDYRYLNFSLFLSCLIALPEKSMLKSPIAVVDFLSFLYSSICCLRHIIRYLSSCSIILSLYQCKMTLFVFHVFTKVINFILIYICPGQLYFFIFNLCLFALSVLQSTHYWIKKNTLENHCLLICEFNPFIYNILQLPLCQDFCDFTVFT